MLYYTREWVKRFHKPDVGDGNGGGAPSNQQQQQQQPVDPFAEIDVDSLDVNARAAIDKAKAEFATLQSTNQRANELVRQHQSERDKATAELNRMRQAIQGDQQHQQNRPETTEDRVYKQLINDGLTPELAKPQAKTLANILDKERAQIQQQMGQQFAPVAALALQSNAEQAFNHAMSTDHIGWSQVPEVAELVWQSALELTRNGQQADPVTIKNLAFMHFGAYSEKNPQVFATLQNGANQPNNGMNQPVLPPTAPFRQPVTTSFSYPGANFIGRQPINTPTNGARTIMDANTAAAVSSVTNIWKGMGLNPKG